MKSDLEALHNNAMQLIGVLAGKGDVAAISRVAATAKQIQQLQEQLVHIEQEIPRMKENLAIYAAAEKMPRPDIATPASGASSNGYGGKKLLRVQVDWMRLGKAGGKEVISEHKSSDTMAKWAGRLYQQMGTQVLQNLSNFRISRGPMISKQPNVDFINKQDSTLYSHQPILDSGYYILTHSQTTQKVGDVRKACQFLGFPMGAVVVDEVEKADLFAALMDL
jgi:hypothetical protein